MFALAQTHSAQHDDLFMAQFSATCFAELDKIKMKQCIPKDPLFLVTPTIVSLNINISSYCLITARNVNRFLLLLYFQSPYLLKTLSQRNRVKDQKKDASVIHREETPNTGTNEKNRDSREAPAKTRRRRMEEKQRTLGKMNSPPARGRTASKQTKRRRKRRTHEEASGGSTRRGLEVPSGTTAWSR